MRLRGRWGAHFAPPCLGRRQGAAGRVLGGAPEPSARLSLPWGLSRVPGILSPDKTGLPLGGVRTRGQAGRLRAVVTRRFVCASAGGQDLSPAAQTRPGPRRPGREAEAQALDCAPQGAGEAAAEVPPEPRLPEVPLQAGQVPPQAGLPEVPPQAGLPEVSPQAGLPEVPPQAGLPEVRLRPVGAFAMAALWRQVSGWRRLRPLRRLATQTPFLGEQSRATASSFLELTANPSRGSREFPCVKHRAPVRALACRMSFGQHRLEEHRASECPAPLEPERFTQPLLDMGFSEDHIQELLTLRPSSHPRQLLDIVSELILLGVNPEHVCVALKTSPQLLKLPVLQMRKRCSHLRKLGLGEGKMKRVLLCCPDILTMHQRDLDAILEVLRDKCLFTVQQVTEILYRCPYVLREDPAELEYKFQYAYFRMGVAHVDIVTSGFLQYSITKIKQRHIFLERLGRYQTPDKKGQTQVPNPLLKNILRVSEAEFLARTACSSAEEFDVFKKLLAREEEEPKGWIPKDGNDRLEEDEEEEQEQ